MSEISLRLSVLLRILESPPVVTIKQKSIIVTGRVTYGALSSIYSNNSVSLVCFTSKSQCSMH